MGLNWERVCPFLPACCNARAGTWAAISPGTAWCSRVSFTLAATSKGALCRSQQAALASRLSLVAFEQQLHWKLSPSTARILVCVCVCMRVCVYAHMLVNKSESLVKKDICWGRRLFSLFGFSYSFLILEKSQKSVHKGIILLHQTFFGFFKLAHIFPFLEHCLALRKQNYPSISTNKAYQGLCSPAISSE